MVNKWWTIHETLGNMVETAKHTQETLEFDELSKLFLKSRNNIPTYPNISQHIPTKDIFAKLVCQRVWMMYFVEQQHFLGFAISWGSTVSTNGRDDGFNKYPRV